MSNYAHGCNKCSSKTPCTCKKPKDTCYSGGCPEKIDSSCVIYKPQGGKSYLSCFLGLPAKSTAEKIFETLDQKLCNLFTIETSVCVQQLLSVKQFVDFKSVFIKLLDYICTTDDSKVKISATDKTSGFLFDKIATVECLKKEVVTAVDGSQTLSISIDYACLNNKLGSCVEVNCCGNTQLFHIMSPAFSVCGNNVITISANNCLGNVIWFKDGVQIAAGTTYTGTAGTYYATCSGSISNTITITNSGVCPSFNASRTGTFYKVCQPTCTSTPVSFTKTYSGTSQAAANALRDNDTSFNSDGQAYAEINGSCINCGNGCIPVYADIVPVNILCGAALNTLLGTSDRNTCLKYIEQNNQCNSTKRWVVYTGSESDGSTCPGCVPNQFSVTSSQSFTRNNCPSGCTPSTVLFERIYTASTLSAAQLLQSNGIAQFNIDGQANANTNGTCTGCPVTCIPTGALICSSSASSISYTDSCGTIIGVATLNNLNTNCSSTSGQGTVIASYVASSGFNAPDYIIEYAITAINGSSVIGPVYQAFNQFTGLIHNRSYTVTMRITRSGQTCSVSNTVNLGDCTSCSQPLGTISITSNTTTVCGNNSVILTATSSNCNLIEWYRVNPATADLLVGTGTSITLQPTITSVYEARCSNCNLGSVVSNTVTISYTGTCSGSCSIDVHSAGNLTNTQRTVFFDGATPLSDYSFSSDGGNTYNTLTASSLVVTTPGTYTYCARKNSDHTCNDCDSFIVNPASNNCINATFNNASGTDGAVNYTDCSGAEQTELVADGSSVELCLRDSLSYSTTVSMNITYGSQCTTCVLINTITITT
jgi:hypothetical protein